MRCPFLREAQVRFCSASAYRKLIIRSDEPSAERCTSPQWTTCAASKQHREDHPNASRCPFLQESLVQYCSVASVSKYIPYTDAANSRCNTENHRYCGAYFEMAEPSTHAKGHVVDGTRLPGDMGFTKNHLWMDENADGIWHMGVDDFFARVIGRVDQVTYVTVSGNEQPTVLLHVRNLDLSVMFPGRLVITGTNSALRATPQNLVTNPYTTGWLFEGKRQDGSEVPPLLRGKALAVWMEAETRRLNEYVQQRLRSETPLGTRLAADGGIPVQGLICHLKREQALHLFNEFFLPQQSRRSSAL